MSTSKFLRMPLAVALMVLSLIAAAGCGGTRKDKSNDAKNDKRDSGKLKGGSESDPALPVLKLTAEEFTREFSSGREPAEKKFENRVVEVTGEVYSSGEAGIGLGQIPENARLVRLKGVDIPENKRALPNVPYLLAGCLFDPDSASFSKAKAIQKGQQVKLRGKFESMWSLGPHLLNGEVLEVK